jgi:hypothetical protein
VSPRRRPLVGDFVWGRSERSGGDGERSAKQESSGSRLFFVLRLRKSQLGIRLSASKNADLNTPMPTSWCCFFPRVIFHYLLGFLSAGYVVSLVHNFQICFSSTRGVASYRWHSYPVGRIHRQVVCLVTGTHSRGYPGSAVPI